MKMILVRFGDLMLKGKNIGFFIKRIRVHIKNKLKDLEVEIDGRHDRLYVLYSTEQETEVIQRLLEIPGIHSLSIVYVTEPKLDAIIKTGIQILDDHVMKSGTTFKIETKRADKTFPMTSLEITQTIAGPILEGSRHQLVVEVYKPEETLYLEVRKDYAYLYLKSIKAMGGFPYGTGGKGLLMTSGGIDSPVAGYLAMKQGIEVELLHFESTPLTPLESVQKVIDLAKIMAKYTANHQIKLHIVPFLTIHERILAKIPDPYIITIMRRMMYRIAEKFALSQKTYCLINGESVGQVASQTIASMQTVEEVATLPILRPVVTYDKQEIITIANQIQTFKISIRPFNDCCSIYVPRNPATKPNGFYASKYEHAFDYQTLIDEAVAGIITITIRPDTNLEVMQYGFETIPALSEYLKEIGE